MLIIKFVSLKIVYRGQYVYIKLNSYLSNQENMGYSGNNY